MDCEIEKISMARLKEMSDQEVLERMEFLMEVQKNIFIEIEMCKERLGLFVQPTKCERCGSTDLRRMVNGYFCRKCGFRKGLIDAEAVQRDRLAAGWPTNKVAHPQGERDYLPL